MSEFPAAAGGPQLHPGLLAGLEPSGPSDPIVHYRKPVIGRVFLERINRGLRLLRGDSLGRVLEVGHGAGMVQLALAPHADELHGIDLDADPAAATALLARAGHGSDLRRGSVLDLPYPDDHFDQLVCFSVLEHLTEYGRALDEMQRVTRPGGQLLIGMPAVDRLMALAFRALGHSQEEVDAHHVTTPAEVFAGTRERGWRLLDEAPLRIPLGPRLYSNWLFSSPESASG